MAMATSRVSLDLLVDLPPLVNPHALPSPHAKVLDLAPAASSLARRVSSESQVPGRASPSSRITRRTPVPFLLEAFPAPPSHIPGTPTSLTSGSLLNGQSLLASATGRLTSTNPVSPSNSNSNPMSPCSPKSVAATLSSPSNPPPSLPPTGPLPPVPGPSTVTAEHLATHRAFQAAARSASPAFSMSELQRSQSKTEQRPRLSLDMNSAVRGRGRQGSLSSLRNAIYPMGEQNETIAEESGETLCPPAPPPTAVPASPPIFGSVAERRSHDQSRGDSPDILRSCLSRVVGATREHANDKRDAEESIANVDMSDLNAQKSDNEGDDDDQASRPFPRFPPQLRSPAQSPTDRASSARYVHTPRKPSRSSEHAAHGSSTSEGMDVRHGAMSPEITQMITATSRPRKRSTPAQSREPSAARNGQGSLRSLRRVDAVVVPLNSAGMVKAASVRRGARVGGKGEDATVGGEDEGNASDSSLDLHTPLPELMLRHGMLSPNSKLLPQMEVDPTRLSILSSASHATNASNLSLLSTMSMCSKHPKDARDTPRRRVRHRDGKLLKGGIGLTTGLGWSDSEDEDAPSQLTRRVSSLVLSRRASASSVLSSRSQPSSASPMPRSVSHSVLREVDEPDAPEEFGLAHRTGIATRSLPSRSKPTSRVGSIRSTGSSLGRYSTYSARTRASSLSESSVGAPDTADPRTSAALMPGIREHDDGVTPTRAAFERSSLGSNGGSGPDIPHTPSSTASSASLPFPVTPEGGAESTQLQPVYNQDKMLPPLPPGSRDRHSSTLSALQRPRTYSSASSVSNSSVPGIPSSEPKSKTASTASTPRQSLAERHARTAIPAASARPSLGGIPRPSLTIPKSPLPPQSAMSALPRPTTPSSPYPNAAQGYTPRPLRLASRSSPLPSTILPDNASSHHPVELNQSQATSLQPGEQSPRPGQVLTYNRNIHDQLKLRTISLNSTHRAHVPVSPGDTQTVFAPSPGPGSGPSTPVTARSQSPLPTPGLGGESIRPRPRTGTGMVYRTNLSVGSVAASRMRVPSTVPR